MRNDKDKLHNSRNTASGEGSALMQKAKRSQKIKQVPASDNTSYVSTVRNNAAHTGIIRPLPGYEDIPDVGLLLDQSARLVNMYLAGFDSIGLTNSMISNYVKHGILPRPVKKLYYREQLASLIFIALSKSVLSLDDTARLLEIQRSRYDAEDAYMLFKTCLENELSCINDKNVKTASAAAQAVSSISENTSEKQSPSGSEAGSDSDADSVRIADNLLLASLVRAISDSIILRRLIEQA